MKRLIFIVLTLVALVIGWYTMHLYINDEPQQHTTQDLFEDIESWRR